MTQTGASSLEPTGQSAPLFTSGLMAGRLSRPTLFKFLIVSAAFAPWILPGGGLPGVRPEWLIVAIFVLVLPPRGEATKVVGYLWLYACCVIASLLYGAAVKGVPVITGDWMEILKPVLYAGTISLVSALHLDEVQANSMIRFVLRVFMVVAAIGIAQFFFAIPLLNSFLELYTTDVGRLAIYRGQRITGTLGQANDFGMFMNFAFALALYQGGAREVFSSRMRWMVHVVLLAAAVVFSGSRTGILCMLLILGMFLLRNPRFRVPAIIGLVGIGFLVFLNVELLLVSFVGPSPFRRIVSIFAATRDLGFLNRVRAAGENLQIALQSIVLGWGPAKAIHIGEDLDNEIVLTLRRYGIVGLTVYFLIARALFTSVAIKVREGAAAARNYSAAIRALLIAALPYAYAAGFFQTFRIMFTFVLLAGLGIAIARSSNENVSGAPDVASSQ
jgi:hypothetical protein